MISMSRLISILLLCVFNSQDWSYVSTISPIYAYSENGHFNFEQNSDSEVKKHNYDGKPNPHKSVVDLKADATDAKFLIGTFLAFADGLFVTKSTRYGPMNPGPLDDATAATFRSGSYTATITSEATTLYRVYGGNAGKLGPYWTRTKPSGPLQSQLDLALVPQWGNTAENVVSIQVPKGTVIYEGAAAPQLIGVGQILGGGNQVYIPRVDPKWIK